MRRIFQVDLHCIFFAASNKHLRKDMFCVCYAFLCCVFYSILYRKHICSGNRANVDLLFPMRPLRYPSGVHAILTDTGDRGHKRDVNSPLYTLDGEPVLLTSAGPAVVSLMCMGTLNPVILC